MLSVSVPTITRMVARGELTVVRLGSLRRFRRADLERIAAGER